MRPGAIGKAREQRIRVGAKVLPRRRLEAARRLLAHQDIDQRCKLRRADRLVNKFVAVRQAQVSER